MRPIRKPELSSVKRKLRTSPEAAAAMAIGAAIFCFTAYYSFFPKVPEYTVSGTESWSDDSAVSEALAAMSLARNNLRSEHYSAKLSGSEYSYFPSRSGIYDHSGQLCYDSSTAVNEISAMSSARSRAMLCRYLYGDVDAGGLVGYLRYGTAGGSEGCSVTLTLRPQLEESLYMLLKYNGIPGGCIVQDVDTGVIEALTATSTAGIDREITGCTQFEANISGEVYQKLGASAEEASSAFGYRSSFTEVHDKEKGELISGYTFLTDFGLLSERPDDTGEPVPKDQALAAPMEKGYISPLHLCSTVQRIWSGKDSMPLLTESVRDSAGNALELPSVTPSELPQELLDRCRAAFTPADTETAKVSIIKNSGEGVKYAAGVVETQDGRKKAFVIYSQEDSRITLLTPCIAYFIEHSEEA